MRVNPEANGPSNAYGEDTVMVNTILPLVHLMGAPQLYTYVVHGNNTCDRQHFDELFRAARGGQQKGWIFLVGKGGANPSHGTTASLPHTSQTEHICTSSRAYCIWGYKAALLSRLKALLTSCFGGSDDCAVEAAAYDSQHADALRAGIACAEEGRRQDRSAEGRTRVAQLARCERRCILAPQVGSRRRTAGPDIK